MAIRPKTLPAAIAPVLIGTGMAFGDGIADFPTAGLCLLGALAIQIGTNLANDYFDYRKGADTSERLGPTRVTQAGLVKPWLMIAAVIFVFSLAAFIAYLLYLRAGQPIAVIGILSIISGVLYTAGPWPLGYVGLGEIFVLIFFGPVAVAGTYYAQSLEINLAVVLAGIAPGLIAMGILTVNNLRDLDGDQKAGKRTLAVRFGRSFAQQEYLFSILMASLMPVVISLMIQDHYWILLACFTSLLAIPSFITVLKNPAGPSLNDVLALTGKLLLVYSVLFTAGWIYEN